MNDILEREKLIRAVEDYTNELSKPDGFDEVVIWLAKDYKDKILDNDAALRAENAAIDIQASRILTALKMPYTVDNDMPRSKQFVGLADEAIQLIENKDAELDRLREICKGDDDGGHWYSQETMNAVSGERDRLAKEVAAKDAEIARLKELIAKSDLIEVEATQVDHGGSAPVIVSAGTILVKRNYLEEEKEKTQLLKKMAGMAREIARLKNQPTFDREAIEGLIYDARTLAYETACGRHDEEFIKKVYDSIRKVEEMKARLTGDATQSKTPCEINCRDPYKICTNHAGDRKWAYRIKDTGAATLMVDPRQCDTRPLSCNNCMQVKIAFEGGYTQDAFCRMTDKKVSDVYVFSKRDADCPAVPAIIGKEKS